MKFEWKTLSFDKESLIIELKLEAPYEISTYEEKNNVELIFNDP